MSVPLYIMLIVCTHVLIPNILLFVLFFECSARVGSREEKTRKFQTQSLHYFSKCDNKSNHHHHIASADNVADFGMTQACLETSVVVHPSPCLLMSSIGDVHVSFSCL